MGGNMRYWKGKPGTIKEGQCGTFDDDGSVPDSDEIEQIEYNNWVAAQPNIPVTDYKALYATATTDAQRINLIAQKLDLI